MGRFMSKRLKTRPPRELSKRATRRHLHRAKHQTNARPTDRSILNSSFVYASMYSVCFFHIPCSWRTSTFLPALMSGRMTFLRVISSFISFYALDAPARSCPP